jgi:membrane fusion protein (multidrug efflux system)
MIWKSAGHTFIITKKETGMVEMPRNEILQRAAILAPDNQSRPEGVDPPANQAPRTHRSAVKRWGFIALAVLATAVAGYYGDDYWTIGRFQVSTDDAYVMADSTTIAPKVAGYLSAVLVQDNQPVTTGQILARIDDRDLRTAFDQARADVAAAAATVQNFEARISLQAAEIAQAQAAVDSTHAKLRFAQIDAARYRFLVTTGAGTLQHTQQTRSARDEAAAQLRHDEAAMLAAQRQVPVLVTLRDEAQAQLEHARAVAHQAELNLSYATITAPIDGTVGARSLRVGQYVVPGTQLLAVVPLSAAYVVANYKETQLAHVRAGQSVSVTIDGLSDITLQGHVDSLSPASGLEFALLPPDNATGNFTKIVQRIPVRISIQDRRAAGLLRAGMSVEPSIDTRPSSTPAESAIRFPSILPHSPKSRVVAIR